jgi:UDP-galactopyranose mutase
MKKYRNIIVGAGITGITIAERLAASGEEALIIEKRDTIGGNCHDYFDEEGNYIQLFGPHIFHTDHGDVWHYLNNFSRFNEYSHRVLCSINNRLINIPFNMNSVELAFDKDKAAIINGILLKELGPGKKVPILELKDHREPLVRELADYVYKNIFLNYTVKQWDLKPDEMDPSVTARVPVYISRDDRYFQSKWQGIPEKGFTEMFNNMLKNPAIEKLLATDYKTAIQNIGFEKMYYTGPLDYYFDYKYGRIKYRKIRLEFEKKEMSSYQENSVINYPNDNDFTRITEFNKFLFIKNRNTVTAKEYASWDNGFEAYPVQTPENLEIVGKYVNEVGKLDNVKFIGRLAECKYYDIDTGIKNVLDKFNPNA